MAKVLIIQPPADKGSPHVQAIESWPDGEIWSRAQKAVDGWIEPVYLTPRDDGNGYHLAAYINEEGRLRSMTPNVVVGSTLLVGPIVIVKERIDGEGETHYGDLSDMDYLKVKSMIELVERA